MHEPAEISLSALLEERRTFRRIPNFGAKPMPETRNLRARAHDPQAFWAAEARHLDRFEPWKTCSSGMPRGQVVHRRQAERRAQLRRSPRTQIAATKAAIVWKADPAIHGCSPTACSSAKSPLRQCAALPGVAQGDRVHLHGHGAGAGYRHARVRRTWRAAQHRLRRIFPPKRCANASMTPRRKSSSPPTAPGAAAHSESRSRPAATKRSAIRPPSKK